MDVGEVLEPVAFLARSSNRVRVLGALAERAHTRDELGERIPATRVTLGRALDTLEERRWVESEGRTYRLTHLGRLVAAEFGDLLEGMDAVTDLESVLPHVPADVDLDVARLRDATVIDATASDPFAMVRRAVERIEAAEDLRLLTNAAAPETLAVLVDRVTEGSLTVELVSTPTVYETMTGDAEMAAGVRTLLESERVECRLYEAGEIPFVTAVYPDSVDLVFDNEQGFPVGFVTSEDPAVVRWAEDRFEAFARASEQVAVETFDWAAPGDG